METTVNVSSSHPFELFSSLQEKMSFWNSYFDFLSCSEPSKEARISTLTVNCQEIEIVVESCKYCAYFVSSKITSSWCKFMRSSFHHGSKDLFLQSKTKSCHLSNGITTVKHMFSPCITVTFPFWEISWGSILCNILHNISDIPKIPPFGIMWSWGWCISLVRILKAIHNIFMISCLLSAFRSGTNLKIEFWEDIRYRSFSIVISRSFFEEVFHLIQKFIVQRRVDSWILDDQTTIFMESFSDLFTLLGVVSCSIQEISYIYYGYRQS